MPETHDRQTQLDSVVVIAAALGCFDQELLAELSGAAQALSWLADSQLAEPAAEYPGAYRLADARREAALAELRAHDALTEIGWLVRAFERWSAVVAAAAPAQREGAELACFYFFDRLLALLVQRNDWEAARTHIAVARRLAPQLPRAQHRTLLYAGYTAINTGARAEGRAALEQLVGDAVLDSETHTRALLGLAQAHWYETRYDLALESYRHLYDLARMAGARLYEGLALINMGGAYNELELYEQALDLTMRSLVIFRELGEPVREAHALYRVGINALHLGRWPLAQEYFDLAIERFESLGLRAGLAMLYWGQGFLAHLLGDPASGEAGFRQALAVAESADQSDQTIAIDAFLRLGFLYQTEARWEAALAAYGEASARAIAGDRRHLLAQILYRRGCVLERQARQPEALAAYQQAIETVEGLRAATTAEEIKIGLLGTTQQIYEAVVQLLLALGRPAEAFGYVERARSRAFLDELARRSPELYDAFDEPVATLAEVQAALPAGAVLVEYFATGVLSHSPGLLHQIPAENQRVREHLIRPPQLWIFVVTQGGMEVALASIDPNRLRPDPRAPVPTRHLLRDRLLPYMYEHLVAPYERALHGCDLLYLIPHGPLHYVPFMALRDMEGRHLLRADGPAIALAPSATVLLRSCLAPEPRRQGTALALGYNDLPNLALRYAEAEAELVARWMGGRSLVGQQPKGAELLAGAPDLSLLHIAGHAFFYPDDPLGSEIHLGEGDRLSARAIISDLQLGADLVVLSACTSGLARVASGDELLGLQRALIAAGARTVVCTLWEATDLPAVMLMDRFYTGLRSGQTPAIALRDAQVALRTMTAREVLATLARWRAEGAGSDPSLWEAPAVAPELLDVPVYADPFHWAPFLLIGRPW